MSGYTYKWVACSVAEFGYVGEKRHLIRADKADALTTVCGHSASIPQIWRSNSRKPKCHVCEQSKANR